MNWLIYLGNNLSTILQHETYISDVLLSWCKFVLERSYLPKLNSCY